MFKKGFWNTFSVEIHLLTNTFKTLAMLYSFGKYTVFQHVHSSMCPALWSPSSCFVYLSHFLPITSCLQVIYEKNIELNMIWFNIFPTTLTHCSFYISVIKCLFYILHLIPHLFWWPCENSLDPVTFTINCSSFLLKCHRNHIPFSLREMQHFNLHMDSFLGQINLAYIHVH